MALISRRRFVQTSMTAGLAIDTKVRGLLFTRSQTDSAPVNTNVLVTIFLRGGADFLNLVVPQLGPDRGHYEAARSVTRVEAADLVPLGDSPFGLHPRAAALGELFDQRQLAVVLGAGLTADTRSHFDAQALMDFGVADYAAGRSGWLARLVRSTAAGEPLLPAVAIGSGAPSSFATSNEVVAVPNLARYGFPGRFPRWQNSQRSALRNIYESGTTEAHAVGLRALAGSNALELYGGQDYTPANGIEYPTNRFGTDLRSVAQLIKSEVGLTAATVDLGGWDTHSGQGAGAGGMFGTLVGRLADSLAAFHQDLDDRNRHGQRTTVVVMSEFGRRVQQNASNGTDHGHGGAMLVLGGSVNGGLYGEWPGLARDALYDGADLAVTTDYRRVLADIVMRHLETNRLGVLFPGYTDHLSMGLVQGEDREPDYTPDSAIDVDTNPQVTDDEPAEVPPVAELPLATNNRDGQRGTALVAGGVGLTLGVAATAGAAAFAKRKQAVARTAETTE